MANILKAEHTTSNDVQPHIQQNHKLEHEDRRRHEPELEERSRELGGARRIYESFE